jgi:hypothetical protein
MTSKDDGDEGNVRPLTSRRPRGETPQRPRSTKTRTQRPAGSPGANGGAVPTPAARDHIDAAVWQARVLGQSYRAIAKSLTEDGYKISHETVRARWYAMLNSLVPVADVEAIRAMEDERLDLALATAMRIMVDQRANPDTRLRAVREVRQLSATRRRMHGADAPVRVEVSETDQTSSVAAEVEAYLAGLDAAGQDTEA